MSPLPLPSSAPYGDGCVARPKPSTLEPDAKVRHSYRGGAGEKRRSQQQPEGRASSGPETAGLEKRAYLGGAPRDGREGRGSSGGAGTGVVSAGRCPPGSAARLEALAPQSSLAPARPWAGSHVPTGQLSAPEASSSSSRWPAGVWAPHSEGAAPSAPW